MQPLIGPPIYIPAHLFANASGGMRIFLVALMVASLVFHIVFLVWGYLFLRRWGRDLDEQERRRQEQERRLDEQERLWREGHRDLDDPVLQLRAASERLQETLDRIRNAETAS